MKIFKQAKIVLLLVVYLLLFFGCGLEPDSDQGISRSLDDGYGVLKGNLVNHYLEDVVGEGRWTHYRLTVEAAGVTYDCAINLQNRAGEILHRQIEFSTMNNDNGIFSLSDGFHNLAMNSSSGALDLIRHPGIMDLVTDHPWKSDNMIVNNTEVPVLESMMQNAIKVYVFGEPYTSGNGVHNIHQNQGNLAGTSFEAANGIWQDGGVIVEYMPLITSVPHTISTPWGGTFTYYTYEFTPRRKFFMTRFYVQKDFTYSNGNGRDPITETVSSGKIIKSGMRVYGPYSASQLIVRKTSSSGRHTIYVKKGSAPTTSSYDVKGSSYIRRYGSGDYYIGVYSKVLPTSSFFLPGYYTLSIEK